jgi:hypothetical protein
MKLPIFANSEHVNLCMRRFILIAGTLFILFSCDKEASFVPLPRLTEIEGEESLTEFVIIDNAPLDEKKLKFLVKQYEKTHPRNWGYRSHYRHFVSKHDDDHAAIDESKVLCSVLWDTNFKGDDEEEIFFYKDSWHL